MGKAHTCGEKPSLIHYIEKGNGDSLILLHGNGESCEYFKGQIDIFAERNFHLTPDAAAARGLELVDGTRLYVDGVLRLVSRSDEEWAELFSPWYAVERLTHFAWPGETVETRRLFYLRKREASVRSGT